MSAVFVFVSGAALLIYSAEKLIGYLVGAAKGLRISLFLLAVIFTGIEFDDVFYAVAANLEDADGVALGVIVGTALSLPGIVLALAAIITPTKVTVPRDYLVAFAAAPLVMIFFVLKAPLTVVDGTVLVALFALFIAYVAVRESRSGTPVFRDAEIHEAYALVREAEAKSAGRSPVSVASPGPAVLPHGEARTPRPPFAEEFELSGWAGLGLAVLALAGLVIGAATMGIGTKGILEDYGLEGTVFGATIATLVLTIEDVFLTVEPSRKGAPEIGVGNVIGSVIFSVTGKLGIVLLAGTLVVGPHVLSWHLPALVVLTWLAGYFLSTGQLKRWHGYTLLSLYLVYWTVSFFAFGLIPADTQ
ncbi:sodium:calcium antiporter [Amycolatopsis pigmentata]|uniref:Sodium:calcium antiporter n=1 Tax=Amycolatopsis pigmentata TaxID=450801 RepID=A0ABW5FYV6_9PSEU